MCSKSGWNPTYSNQASRMQWSPITGLALKYQQLCISKTNSTWLNYICNSFNYKISSKFKIFLHKFRHQSAQRVGKSHVMWAMQVPLDNRTNQYLASKLQTNIISADSAQTVQQWSQFTSNSDSFHNRIAMPKASIKGIWKIAPID